MTAETRNLPGRITAAAGELSYAVNARLTEAQRAKLARMAAQIERTGPGSKGATGAAIRAAIDAYGTEARMQESPEWTEGRVQGLEFGYVDELQHIEVLLAMTEVRQEPVEGGHQVVEEDRELGFSIDLEIAEQLLAQLSAAVSAAREAAGTDA